MTIYRQVLVYGEAWIDHPPLAADATTQGQFVSGVARLTRQLQQQGFITRAEQVSLLRCAAQAEIP